MSKRECLYIAMVSFVLIGISLILALCLGMRNHPQFTAVKAMSLTEQQVADLTAEDVPGNEPNPVFFANMKRLLAADLQEEKDNTSLQTALSVVQEVFPGAVMSEGGRDRGKLYMVIWPEGEPK